MSPDLGGGLIFKLLYGTKCHFKDSGFKRAEKSDLVKLEKPSQNIELNIPQHCPMSPGLSNPSRSGDCTRQPVPGLDTQPRV